jgi:hypothetical protein
MRDTDVLFATVSYELILVYYIRKAANLNNMQSGNNTTKHTRTSIGKITVVQKIEPID